MRAALGETPPPERRRAFLGALEDLLQALYGYRDQGNPGKELKSVLAGMQADGVRAGLEEARRWTSSRAEDRAREAVRRLLREPLERHRRETQGGAAAFALPDDLQKLLDEFLR